MAKKHSRTTNTIYNFTSSIGGQLLSILMQFVTRTVFISTLGKSYLGIGGLFNNILYMLALAEFGVGSAILFKLYDPIAKEDHHRIAVLMQFYKKVYRVIGIVIAGLGCCMIPFLPMIIKDYSRLETLHINAVLIFGMYLFRIVSSYLFFAYKTAIIKAHQKEYILNLISYLFTILLAVVQIISLLIFKNFIVYVALSVLEVIIRNIICAKLSDKMYPYIREHTAEKLDRAEIREIVKDCMALFLYRMNQVVLKATDNMVISAFLGLESVALYANYVIFYNTVNSLFSKIYNSVSHSLGNLHTIHDEQREYQVFKSFNLITAILGGTAGVGVAVVADEFVRVWVGADWVIAQPFSVLLGIEVYTLALRQQLIKYRTTMGLFQQAKYRPIASMIINLVVSILLVKNWGITGVLVGTVTADWTTTMWYDPLIIHKYGFKGVVPASQYFLRLATYTVLTAAIGVIDRLICSHVFTGFGWFSVIVHAAICAVTVPAFLVAFAFRTTEGQYVWKLFMNQVKLFRKKLHR